MLLYRTGLELAERGRFVSPRFATTRWSLIRAAGGADGDRAREALATLFEGYWFPVYAFIRGQGFSDADAEDLAQDYFATMLEKGGLERLRPEAGRFRSFLLVSIRNFLNNVRDHRRALKRGGGKRVVSLDAPEAEARLRREPVDRGDDAGRVFERHWAATVVWRTVERLEGEFERAGQAERFRLLRGHLTGDEPGLPYAELAERLSLTEAGVKSLVHRMRKRFGVLLRGEVLHTVGDVKDVDDEMRHLLRILAER